VQILKQILEAKEKMGDTMKASFFSMTEAKYAAGDSIKHTIFDNVETAQVRRQKLSKKILTSYD
jgi:V-type H+-transporting ATPase subunit D